MLCRMTTMIQVRHVPNEVHRELKIRAVKEGLSLSAYLVRQLAELTRYPTLDDVIQRLATLPPIKVSKSPASVLRSERARR